MSGEAEENCYSGASDFLLHDQHLHHAASLSTSGNGQGRKAKWCAISLDYLCCTTASEQRRREINQIWF